MWWHILHPQYVKKHVSNAAYIIWTTKFVTHTANSKKMAIIEAFGKRNRNFTHPQDKFGGRRWPFSDTLHQKLRSGIVCFNFQPSKATKQIRKTTYTMPLIVTTLDNRDKEGGAKLHPTRPWPKKEGKTR